MQCPECRAECEQGRRFCGQCGAPLSVTCGSCGFENAAEDKFCGGCGKLLVDERKLDPRLKSLTFSPPSSLADKALGKQSALEGRRRQVTVLFADMAGYTSLAESLGEEGTYRLMHRVFERMIDAVHSHEGTVQELTGDGLMALFGAPVALEDAPLRACRASLEIQDRMAKFEWEIDAEKGLRPNFRIGIHTGPVVVGKVGDDLRMEFTALGDTVNLASRLESLADPGTIVISEETHRLVEGYVESSFAGEREIKGKTVPHRLYRLDGLKSRVTRFDVSARKGLTQLVGRRRELEILVQCWEEARKGDARFVEVVGEAGLGKSRLMYEFRERLADRNVLFLQGNCTADGVKTPFLPFIDVVRASFHIVEREARQEIERKVRRELEILGLTLEGTLPYFMNLLGHEDEDGRLNKLDSEVVGIRTREALLELLRERLRLSPLVLFIDDTHWVDSASEALLLRAAQGMETLPLMLVCAHRPAHRSPWAEQGNVTRLQLEPLSENSTIDLLKHRLDAQDLPGEFAHLVANKAEGNPLFTEEIANYLLEKGTVQKGDDGFDYQPGSEVVGLPVTLENLLMERFDRLGEERRAVLETASVMGQRFSLDLACHVAGVNGAATERLLDLEHQELIFREPDGNNYRFKHVLVRDAIYEGLLNPHREELHEKVAQAIEQANADRLPELVDVLAHHYSHTPRTEKAVHYLALAGERSLLVYSLEEAESRFLKVLELIEQAPDCADDAFLVDVLLNQARIYYFNADFTGLIEMMKPHRPIVERLGDKRRLSRFLFELGYAHVFSGEQQIGKPLLERALSLGEEIGDDESVGYASMGLLWQYVYWEPPSHETRETVRRLSDQAVQIGKRINDVWLASKGLLGQGIDHAVYGRPHEARQCYLGLFELSRETGDPRPKSMGLWALGILNAYAFNYQEAVQNAQDSLRISLSPLDRLSARAGEGIGLSMSGRVEEGLEILRNVRREMMVGKFLPAVMGMEMHYGAIMLLGGEMAGGVAWIEEAMRRFQAWGFQIGTALGHMVLGDIYLQIALGEQNPPLAVILKNLGFVIRTVPFAKGKARRHLEEAVKAFRDLDTPFYIAWGLFDLGLLYKKKRRLADAQAYLKEARDIAERVEAASLVEKIDLALRSLPT